MEIDRVAAWLERPDLLGIFLVSLAIFVIGRIPVISLLVYPFYLFYVFVHELSHGFVTMVTGGRFDHFTVNRNLTGYSAGRGGDGCLITSAGYLGAGLFGAALLVLSASDFPARVTVFVLGLGLAMLVVRYARNLFGLLFGIALAAALMYAGTSLSESGAQVLLWLLAINLFLRTLARLLGFSELRGTQDAADMARETGLPPRLWELLWAVLVGLALLYALNIGYGVPLPWERP
jgi:hypothetical protein